MFRSTWNVVFIAVAVGAGMFAQQAAHKVSAASEDRQVNSLVGSEVLCSAEDYYLAGRFDAAALAAEPTSSDPASRPIDEQPLLADNGSPAGDVPPLVAPEIDNTPPVMELASKGGALPGMADSLPAASDGAGQPPPETVAAAESPEPAAAPPEAAAPELAGAAVNTAAPAEVLPPPAPDTVPGADRGGFDSVAEDRATVVPSPATIRAPLPPAISAPANSTYYNATADRGSRYATPADLVRERAIARGEQRRQRVETRKWLGISPLRPTVDSTPYSMVEQPAQLLLVVPDSPATLVR